MKSGRKATGKNPLEESWERDFDKHDVELAIEKNPDLQAVGLYTRYLQSSGRSSADIFGAYPGGHSSEEGFYTLTGDLSKIPVAPAWLLAEMKAPPKPVQNKKDLDFSDRTEDEIAQIIHDCLSVISHQGLGSREHWVRVGMAIHSALPNDLGLSLWSFWSAQDPDFAAEWEDAGDYDTPCTTAWYSFKAGGIGLGTLIWLADREDPERHRFSAENKKIVKEAEEKKVQEVRTSTLDFGDVIKRAKNILELDNPAEMNYKLNTLALKAGYRDQSSLEKLIVDQIQYESQKGILDIADLFALDIQREYLIPDILPTPSVVLIYGAGGDGKSMSAWTMAKHIATGDPFLVRGSKVPVDQGNVLLLNGDQPLSQLKEQLEEVNFPIESNVKIQTDWQLQRYAQFIKLMQTYTPKLVVIDSLIGCSGGRAFDENKSDFAQPLYWLTRNNGVLFPRTTILIIHHANKNGGFRGTSAIRDAVDETWKLSKPTQEQINKVGRNSRFITIEKSRSGRMGTQMIMKMKDDLTFAIADYTPEVSDDSGSPTTVQDKVLQKLRKIHPETYTINQMIHDPMVDGKDAAIRKSFQRLLKKGLIELIEDDNSNKSYRAVLARGEGAYLVPLEES